MILKTFMKSTRTLNSPTNPNLRFCFIKRVHCRTLLERIWFYASILPIPFNKKLVSVPPASHVNIRAVHTGSISQFSFWTKEENLCMERIAIKKPCQKILLCSSPSLNSNLESYWIILDNSNFLFSGNLRFVYFLTNQERAFRKRTVKIQKLLFVKS